MENNPFLPNLIFYFLILLTTYLSTYIIGRLTAVVIPEIYSTKNTIERIFNYLVLGFVVLVSIFAIIWTKGNSIFLISILIFGIYFHLSQQETNRRIKFQRISKRELISFFSVLLLFGTSFILSYYLFFIRARYEPWCDHVFYANVSNVLCVSHIESSSIFLDNSTTNMYHFGEIWFNSFWSIIFNANKLHVLLIVTYSYLFSLCVLGGISVAQLFFKRYFLSILIGISFLFFKPVVSFFFDFIEPIAGNPKLFSVSVILLFATIQYLKENYNFAFISVLFLVPFYSTMAPGILSGLFILVLCFEYSKNRFQSKIFFNKYAISCILVFLVFILFYSVQSFRNNNQDSFQTIFLYEHPIKRTLLFILKRSIRVIILLIPITFLLSYVNIRKKNLQITPYWMLILFAIFGVFLSSIVGGISANFVLDGGQICTNFTDTVVNVVIFTCFIYLLSIFGKNRILYVAIISFVTYIYLFTYRGLTIFYPLSTNTQQADEYVFYNKLKIEILNTHNYEFAYYRNYNIKDHINSQYTRLNMFFPLSMISHIVPTGYYAPYCLSVFDIPTNTSPLFNEIKRSDFWKYVQYKRSIKPTVLISECALDFIKEKNIRYIIVEKQAISPVYLKLNARLIFNFEGNKIYKMNEN